MSESTVEFSVSDWWNRVSTWPAVALEEALLEAQPTVDFSAFFTQDFGSTSIIQAL